MKNRKIISILIFFFVSQFICSDDRSIYAGKWKSDDGQFEINISLKKYHIKFEQVIVKKKNLRNFNFEFLYGEEAIVPFLFISSEEKNVEKGYWYHEHRLYLTIGSANKDDNYNLIRGFYEVSKTRDDEHGTMEIEFYPIELIKVVVARQ